VLRSVGNLFGMPNKSSAHTCIMQVLHAIVSLKEKYVMWPDVKDYPEIAAHFETVGGFPNVVGAIDGTHIPIKPPSCDRDSFINRKGWPSINVMAVCDHRKVFTAVFADRAGSVHDARVFRVSPLGHQLEHGDIGDGRYHIIGDSAYPLLPQLMVPYKDNGHLTAAQRKYNLVHASTRGIVERAFVQLKGKFRRLRGLECNKICNSLLIIDAAFILHNFVLLHDQKGMEGFDEDDETCEGEGGDANTSFTSAKAPQKAIGKRDHISAALA